MANKKNGNDYYEMFVSLVNYSCQAAEGLHHTLVNFNPESLPETMASMHRIEHAADDEPPEKISRLLFDRVLLVDIIHQRGRRNDGGADVNDHN